MFCRCASAVERGHSPDLLRPRSARVAGAAARVLRASRGLPSCIGSAGMIGILHVAINCQAGILDMGRPFQANVE